MSDIPHLDGQKLVHISPSRLKPHPTNPRTHSKEQVKKIAASIRRFGFRNPVLVDEEFFSSGRLPRRRLEKLLQLRAAAA